MFSRCMFFLMLLPLFILGCTKDSDIAKNADTEALIFGTFYGLCGGTGCVQVFKIEGGKLYEDTSDNYPYGSKDTRRYEEVSADAAEILNNIDAQMTSGLTGIENSTIGCPDCYDQGGVYLESIDADGISTFWVFDQTKASVPQEFHPLLDVIIDTVGGLD